MSNDDLQSIVDELAERLRRSVAIDDPTIRLLAASRHFGDEDPVRVGSVLNRSVDSEMADRVLALGIARWDAPGVMTVEGALPRLCVPVRCNDMLLGYLWLIDKDGEFTGRETSAASEVAATVGTLLYRRLLLHERWKARQEGILRELVSTDDAVRAQAVEDMIAEQLLGDECTRFTVLAVQCRSTHTMSAPQQVAFEAAIEEGTRTMGEPTLMVANRTRAWILLIQRRSPSKTLVDSLADRIAGRFRRLTDDSVRLVFGLGGTVDRIDAVATSYQQALLAARAAMLLPSVGELARWGELGAYELLLKLPLDDLLNTSPVPALAVLEKEDSHHVLIDTLTVFFDYGGNIQRIADSLNIHRATLYQRLKRVEQITGCSFDNGDDRLMLHLGLKLRALSNAYRDQFGG
ncbi:CdaR family transcriptional regulator [Amycolatopsis antarctica]|uniref:CdaR family transcriptional regulator n=1 Tax=Amycolatopsis antarctica TaxID=1854586 RepID=A0A263CWV6_9PSEU|nr:helix-turn-helix domain-containing protein [Amycolatopsis antarctica]OZM70630.1 CdaR family transcriptional regulator [Amycolatopsis antarctica]